MAPRFGNTLKSRIAAVAGALFLAGILVNTVFVSHILRGDMQDMLFRQQETSAGYIARDIDAKVAMRLESLKRVAQNLPRALFEDPPAMQQWLDDRRAIQTLFPVGLLVVPADGGPVLAQSPKVDNRPTSFTDRDWFIGATTTRQPYVSKPLITRATQEPAITVAVPVDDAQGRLLGLLVGIVPLTTPGFLDLILGTRPSEQGNYELIDPRNGVFVLTTYKQQALKPLPGTGNDPVIDAATAGMRGTHALPGKGGDELVSIIAIDATGWLLIARQPAGAAFAPVSNTQRNTLMIAAVLAAPLIVALLTALDRLLKPLARLAGDLRSMAEGSRPMQPIDTQSADEVADVANSFNRLQHKLLEQEQKLAEMVHLDTLTGLPNRLLVYERLENELHRIQRNGLGLALLFLDLDGFKPVNDTYGHQVGDVVLAEVAKRLRDAVREVDTVARLGGDEFLILLNDTEQPVEAAERVARQCIDTVSMPFGIDSLLIRIGVSIGIAVCDGEEAHATNAERLVNEADSAMYRAKAEGRNRYVLHNDNPSPTPANT